MKLYFAGTEGRWLFTIVLQHTRTMLVSAFHLGYRANIQHRVELCNLVVDSGGFTARMRGEKIPVEDYAMFLNRNGVKLAFNLDSADPLETARNQAFLEVSTPAYIIPIYHVSDYLDARYRPLIDSYVANYPFVAVGGVAGVVLSGAQLLGFMDHVFSRTLNTVKVHGLGITTQRLMEMYPFYSVDSTSWLAPAKWGTTRTISSTQLNRVKFWTKEVPKKRRLHAEVEYYLHQMKVLTRLWEARGVSWDD